jgi:hypothetical protein
MNITQPTGRLGRPHVRGQTRHRTLSHCERLEQRLVLSTFTVDNLLDTGPGSLRDAIDAANIAPGPDAIEFAGGVKGAITLATQLHVTDDLTITGRGEDKIILSGNHATRVLSVTGADTHLALRHLTIADGLASAPGGTALGGGILNDGASLSLDHVTFEDNRSVGLIAAGGAIANIAGHLDANHTDFVANTIRCADGRDGFGGAVFNDRAAHADIAHSTFSHNQALDGGANGGAIAVTDGSQLNLQHSAFHANQAVGSPEQYGAGGAIVVQSTGLAGSSAPLVNIAHCSFTANRAAVRAPVAAGPDARGQAFGGAIIVEFGPPPPAATPPAPTLVIEHSSFDANSAEGRSAGTANPGATGRLGGPAWGGAVHNVSSNLILRNSAFTNNLAKGGDGGTGGTAANGGAGNFALGGAVVSGTLTPLTGFPDTIIQDCTFVSNRAIGGNGGTGGPGANGGAAGRADGAGVVALGGTMTIDDSSILANTALGGQGGAAGAGTGTRGGDGGLTRGAGFANERGSQTTLRRTSIASNQALGGPGGPGRPGGDALGGGVFNGRPNEVGPNPALPANLTLIECSITGNLAQGGAGGTGANGGNALGGGILNANPIPVPNTPILTLLGSSITANQATGGAAGAGGASGSGTGGASGSGTGGGLYNQLGALATADPDSIITANHASTSNDDLFGTVTIL